MHEDRVVSVESRDGDITIFKQHVSVEPTYCQGADPFESVEWEHRSATLKNADGKVMFTADGLEFPQSWSQNCTALVAEKYFRHVLRDTGTKVRETSVRQMVSRVAGTIARWGVQLGYFKDEKSNGHKAAWEVFRDELAYILVNQMAAFNSPVWFNVGTNLGIRRTEQCSACFINSVEDDMSSILELGRTEGALYKGGSGSGVNYSKLRSSREKLSGGGYASGPVPFIAKDDMNAGAIKSGGTTRRAAKMVMLDVDHGDIIEFIRTKAMSERAAHALIDSLQFTGDFRDRWGAYGMVPFQNANHSVRVTDDFMRAVELDHDWILRARDGSKLESVKARAVWKEICAAAWFCGDPGLQYDTTINRWHTSPASGKINGSNPCSEYMYLDDTACNLASLNLLKFLRKNGGFDIESFNHTVDVVTLAQEIIVDGAGYPTPLMEANSSKYRTLGIGYSNLGSLLMAQGLAYDSNEGRAQAAYVTSLLTARAYAKSSDIAHAMGPFEAFPENRDAMLDVMRMHKDALTRIPFAEDTMIPAGTAVAWDTTCTLELAAQEAWERTLALGVISGYRNGQISVLAPAGTISFLMDCDTTGIEPDLSLAKVKKLVGGGTIVIVNQQVPRALEALGYLPSQIEPISEYIKEKGSAVGAPGLAAEHLPVFDTAFADPIGGRSLRPEAHLFMMAAVQPFVSGAISKTVNLPSTATEDDIGRLYMLGWKKGLKAVALYRDGCKRTQPLSTRDQKSPEAVVEKAVGPLVGQRRKLPRERKSITHKFDIVGHEGYIHVGMYDDGTPGELFIKMSKEGSTVSGLMDSIGILTSIGLQYGVPLSLLIDKFSFTSFEPKGMTDNPKIRFAQSVIDYVFRWLEQKFCASANETPIEVVDAPTSKMASKRKDSGLTCQKCGNPAQRAGTCISCPTCGTTSGCA